MKPFPIILFLFFLFPTMSRAEKVTIRGLTIEEKANGTLIRIQTTAPLGSDQLTAWSSKTGWFYVTIMNAAIDTTKPFPSPRAGLVYDFQAHQLPEQVQLSFRLTGRMDTFEIETSPGGRESIITLRAPLDRTLTTIEKLRPFGSAEVTEERQITRAHDKLRRTLPNVLMTSGSALIVVGLAKPGGVEFILGAGCLAAGYLLRIKGKTGTSEGGP